MHPKDDKKLRLSQIFLNFKKNSVKYGLLSFFVLLIGIIFIGSYSNRVSKDARSKAQESTERAALPWVHAKELLANNRIPAPRQILQIGLTYRPQQQPTPNLSPVGTIVPGIDETSTSQITINNARRMSAYPSQIRVPPSQSGITQYKAQLVDQKGSVLEEMIFYPSNKIRNEKKETMLTGGIHELPEMQQSISMLWKEGATQVRILGSNQNVLTRYDLSQVETLSNTPDYYMINGRDVLRATPTPYQITITPQPPEEKIDASDSPNTDTVKIAFISDRYTHQELELGEFRDDVVDIIDFFTNGLEPYYTRASQIHYTLIPNLDDLDCELDPIWGYECNPYLIEDRANRSGAEWDVAYVVINSNMAPSGASSAIILGVGWGTNHPTFMEEIFTHEFGHMFAWLADEYDLYDAGPLDGQIHDQNCLAGYPPATAWENIVSVFDYHRDCTITNWYRSSEFSIMYDSSFLYYNTPSLRAVNNMMDNIATTSNDHTSPSLIIRSPSANQVIYTDTFPVMVEASDNNSVHRIEYSIDSTFLHTSYIGAPDEDFNLSMLSNGPHVLVAEAFDAVGNSTVRSVNYSVCRGCTHTITPGPSPTPTIDPRCFPTSRDHCLSDCSIPPFQCQHPGDQWYCCDFSSPTPRPTIPSQAPSPSTLPPPATNTPFPTPTRFNTPTNWPAPTVNTPTPTIGIIGCHFTRSNQSDCNNHCQAEYGEYCVLRNGTYCCPQYGSTDTTSSPSLVETIISGIGNFFKGITSRLR